MKKTISILLAAVMLLTAASLCACSGGNDPKTEDGPSVSSADGVSVPADNALNPDFSDLHSFSGATLDGGVFTQEDFAGHDLTVINFWATYCGPCLNEMEELALFQKSLPGRVQFLTLCTDAFGNEETARSILSEAGYEGKTMITWDGDLTDLLKEIQYVPTTLFFDSQGNCVGKEIIGGVSDFEGTYKKAVNNALTLLGLENI